MSSSKAEVFVVSRYLFGANYFAHGFKPFHTGWVNWVMSVVERVYIWFLGGSLNLNLSGGSGVNLLPEGFKIGRVSGVEFIESFLGDVFESGELIERGFRDHLIQSINKLILI